MPASLERRGGFGLGGRGFGRLLLAELLARCESAGARQMLAVIGDSANAASIGLHRALGFEHVGTMKAAGWKFLQYMLEPAQGIAWHMKGSYLPWLEDVVDSPEVEKFWAEEYDGEMLEIATEQLDKIDPFQPGPLMGPYPEYTNAVKSALDEVMFNNADPADALAEAEKRVNEALERYNG